MIELNDVLFGGGRVGNGSGHDEAVEIRIDERRRWVYSDGQLIAVERSSCESLARCGIVLQFVSNWRVVDDSDDAEWQATLMELEGTEMNQAIRQRGRRG